MSAEQKQKILIVDDSELNRAILADMLDDEYEIIEAENGLQGVGLLQQRGSEISLVLLDIVMPQMDGFGVLDVMGQNRWIEDIPVIMISAETGSSHIERAYELGVTDFISRPFDALIVHRRVVNTIMLYAKQKRLANMVADQIYENEQRSSLLIDILSHIVEFRNGESGLHVLNVRTLTELMLQVSPNKYVFLLFMNVFLLICGMFLEGNAIMIILVPLLFPIAMEYGINEIQILMVIIFNVSIGCMTPPMGTLMFVVCNETGCKLKDFIKESVPFFVVLLAELLMLTFIPVLTTGLVTLFGG